MIKKYVLLFICICSFPILMQADPAKKVNLSYANGKLKIEAIHKVQDVNKHYIDKIVIIVDGKEVQTITPKKQSSLGAEVMEIALPQVKKGSKIEVKTRCNEFGNKSGSITVK